MPNASDWPPARLHVVTGKGGTGKTTVAAALAIALARGGRRTLLVEVEGRQGIAQVFDCPQLPYGERRVAVAPDHGEVFALAVDPEEALLEYLELFYNLRRAGRALRRLGAIDFATTLAPGVRDVLLTGKVKEAVTRVEDRRRVYDAVVLDAPPTGRITRFLSVTGEVAGLAKVGPIKTQSEGVMAILRSSQSAVHVVTTLEEMPVQETIDAVHELHAARLTTGALIVNMTQPSLLGPRELERAAGRRLDTDRLAAALTSVDVDAELAGALVDEAHGHAIHLEAHQQHTADLAELAMPTYTLPLLTPPMDLGGVYELADLLSGQGVTTT